MKRAGNASAWTTVVVRHPVLQKQSNALNLRWTDLARPQPAIGQLLGHKNRFSKIMIIYQQLIETIGGRGEIRTHETLTGLPVFKTGALNHSATLPRSTV